MPRKTALVTGGTRGIGREIALDLSRSGYLVFSVSRKTKETGKGTDRETDSIRHIRADITTAAGLDAIYERLRQEAGSLDLLVNNAGIMKGRGIEETTGEDWQQTMELNLNAPFRLVKSILPLMKENGGSIVNISSIASKFPGSSIAYSTSKAGLDMLTRYLAAELAVYGIRVNSVNPGLVDTGFHVSNGLMQKDEYDQFVKEVHERNPLGVGTEKDVSALVLFLAGEQSRWVTGSIYVIDGGRLVSR